MTRPVAACPNCSAPVEFRWSSAVQTVCGHCRSVVVRHDVDLKAVGVVADLPLSGSPIQIGTRGRFQGDAFTVTGRIVYEYEHGTWNEWHVVFADDSSGWLSDAQAEYAVSRVVEKPASLPAAADLEVGQTFAFGDLTFQLTTLTRARYRGVEGELPFEYWDKDEVLFADLRTADGHFATHRLQRDAAAAVPRRVRASSTSSSSRICGAPDAGPQVKTAGFNCRNCGAAIELRAVELTKSVACTSCAAIQEPERPQRPDPAGGAGARALRAEDPAGHTRHVARPCLRGHRLPVPLHRRRRRAVRLGRVPALQPRAGLPLPQRVSGPLERHHDAAGCCRSRRRRADGPRRATAAGRSSCSRRRRRPPTTCSASFRGACGRTTWPASATTSRRRCCCRPSAPTRRRRGRWASTRPATAIWKAFELPGDPPRAGGRLCQPALAPQGQGRVVLDDLCRAGAAGGRCRPRARGLRGARAGLCRQLRVPARPPSTRRLSPRRSR